MVTCLNPETLSCPNFQNTPDNYTWSLRPIPPPGCARFVVDISRLSVVWTSTWRDTGSASFTATCAACALFTSIIWKNTCGESTTQSTASLVLKSSTLRRNITDIYFSANDSQPLDIIFWTKLRKMTTTSDPRNRWSTELQRENQCQLFPNQPTTNIP